MQIAIDGPAGSGKSTISKIIADKLNFIYLDTGAMYRAVALACLENNIIYLNEDDNYQRDGLKNFLKTLTISFIKNSIYLNDNDISEQIRMPNVRNIVSYLAKNPDIREDLTLRQQKFANEHNVVMDGRDIGTCVLPNADLKIFLTASIEIRAKRRFNEIKDKENNINMEDIKKSIQKRDCQDTNRKVAPLRQAEDAILIDTSNLTVDEVVDKILYLAKQRNIYE